MTDIGGPFQYAYNLEREFQKLEHKVRVVSYGRVEKLLPMGLSHIYFFLKILPSVLWSDCILTLDTFSVGVPTALATKLLGRKLIVRVGGDFLWESYVNRTGEMLTLPVFYEKMPELNVKEKIILYLTKVLLNWSDCLAFNTEWQKKIWNESYDIPYDKSVVVRNYIPAKEKPSEPAGKIFLWAGRDTKVKNLKILEEVASEIDLGHADFKLKILPKVSHGEFLDNLKNAYAVVHPSVSDMCPNFILEAVSFGKPFIMTRETGLGEIYDKGGIFVDPLDKDELARVMKNMLKTEEYERYVNELRLMNKERSWAVLAEEFVSICKRI